MESRVGLRWGHVEATIRLTPTPALPLTGGGADQHVSQHYLSHSADCTVENVLIEGARSGGIVLGQTCTNIVLHGVITNSVISESTSRSNVAAGLSNFDANLFVDNGHNGIWQAGANSVNNVVDGGLSCGNGMNAIEESFPGVAPFVVFSTPVCP